METTPASRNTIVLTLLLAVFFAGAYGQRPLFSSNQNTYFLRGLALADGGPILQDWLVNTTNHIPVFSAYVFAVAQWLHCCVFYFVHAALIAVYALCLMWLSRQTLSLSQLSPSVVLSVVVLAFMHSDYFTVAILPTATLTPTGTVSFFLKYATEGLAGQPLLRHYNQPSSFIVILLVSLCAFLAGKRRVAAVTAGLTPWVHPVFFLPAGTLTIAYMLIECRQRRMGQALQVGLLAFAIVLPPLLYTWVYFSPTTAEIASSANKVLVHLRFPHHADPKTWFGASSIFQLAWIIAGLIIARRNWKLYTILMTLFTVASILTLAQVLMESDTLAMLQPWRLSVLLVPISTALLITSFTHKVLSRARWTRAYKKSILVASFALMAALFVTGVEYTFFRIERRKYPSELVNYISNQCCPDDTFLVPPQWQWFRLATRRPIYVDWKSHPYRDIDVLEWYERVQLARAFYDAEEGNAIAALEQIQKHTRITHLVLDREARLPDEYMKAKIVFRSAKYLVYELDKDELG